MPGHAAAAGSNVGSLLEGFLSGATTGLELRGRRTDRRRLAGLDLAESARPAELDHIDAEDRKLRLRGDREDRAFRLFEFSQAHPEVRFDASLSTGGPASGTAQGTPPGLRIRSGDDEETIRATVGQFRERVGENLLRTPLTERDIFAGARVGQFNDQAGVGALPQAAGPTAPDLPRPAGVRPAHAGGGSSQVTGAPAGGPPLPRGFVSTGFPSLDELSEERRGAVMEQIVELISSKDPRGDLAGLEGAPDLLDLLMGENEMSTVFGSVSSADAPPVSSPLQMTTDQGGSVFTFDPRGEPGERLNPLLLPSGEQFQGRRPADNFARSSAQAATQAISRIDPFAFEPGAERDAEEERVAQRFGFDGVEHVQRVLAEAVGGDAGPTETGEAVDVEARAAELRTQGLSNDEIIAQLRSEGLIVG